MKKVAINGYGRIGQSVLRAIYEANDHHGFEVVAINSLSDIETLAYMTRYDTNHGRFPVKVDIDGSYLILNGDRILITSFESPEDLPWEGLNIDLLFECSGAYSDRETALKYTACGPKRILLSHPANNDVDATIVFGVNHTTLSGKETIVSAGSCTTNCVIPLLSILQENWGIQNGLMTTIHSSMNDQPMVDSSNAKNLRLSRSGLQSIIPIETSLAKGIERIYPDFKDKFDCLHIRVPTMNVSAMDLSINLAENTTMQEVNAWIKEAAYSRFNNVLDYTEEPHASVDFNHDRHSGILDATQTKVNSGRTVKLFCWFDNEWGFSNRLIDVAKHWLQTV